MLTWRALSNARPRPTRTTTDSSVLRHGPVPRRPALQAPLEEEGDEAESVTAARTGTLQRRAGHRGASGAEPADRRRGGAPGWWILDIDVVCRGTPQRYVDHLTDVDQGSPGRAEACAAIKAAKYADQPHFVPLHQQAGPGRGPAPPPTPGPMSTSGDRQSPQDVALRGVMQALVRTQAYRYGAYHMMTVRVSWPGTS